MKVITAIYDGREIKPAEPIKTKKETQILMIFPDDNEKDVEEITPEKAEIFV